MDAKYIGRIAVAAAASAALVAAWFFFFGEPAAEERPRAEAVWIPDIVLTDAALGAVRLSDTGGTAMVAMLYASWCPACAAELRDLAAARSGFGERVRVAVVSRGESSAAAAEILRNAGIDPAGMVFLTDAEDALYGALGGQTMPEIVFVDRDGFVRDRIRGQATEEDIRRRIERLIGR